MDEKSAEPAYIYEGGPEAAGTLVIKLGYRGEGFCGFAEQPAQRTVAGELRRALETTLRRPCELTCAGRTDAGVHAIAQYVSVPVTESELMLPGARLMRSLVALTPDDLSIGALFRTQPSFSARFDALSRSYRYRICAGDVRPVLAWDHAWWYKGQLNVGAMNEASKLLLGEHDFKSFCKAQSAIDKPTCRYVMSAFFEPEVVLGEETLVFDIVGNAFLHSMVRSIVGTLVEVGLGRRPVEWVSQALAACERCAAGPCATACGLKVWGAQ